MQFKTKLFVSTLMLLLPLAFSEYAFATNDGNSSNSGKNNNSSNSSHNNSGYGSNSNNNNYGHDDDHDDDDDDHDWGSSHNGKVFICHRTSSSKNPFVLIEVSTSAKQAHYDHGDPVQFIDKGKGNCAAANPPPPPAAPTVSVTLVPSEIAIGATAKLSWTSTGATSCKLSGVGSLYANSFSVSINTSGWYTKGPFSKAGEEIYTIKCDGPGGTDSESVTLKVGSQQAAPTVSLSLAANTIGVDTTTTASWTSLNATSCTLGNSAVPGTVTVPLSSTNTVVGPFATAATVAVTITCTGAGGTTATDTEQLLVKVLQLPPTVSLSLPAAAINVNTTTEASWMSSGADSCTLGNDAVPGTVAVAVSSLSTEVGPFGTPGTVMFTVTCTNAAGTTADSEPLLVKALPLPPTVTLTLAASEIYAGTTITSATTTTASWESTGADSCTFGNGNNPASGSTVLGPYPTAATYPITITCTSNATGATAADTKSLVVKPLLLPTVSLTLTPSTIDVGQSTTATWVSANADSCTIDGKTILVTSPATTSVGPFLAAGSPSISITCNGLGGAATTAQTLQVKAPTPPPVPAATLTLALGTIQTGVVTTLNWTSAYVTSCTVTASNVSVSVSLAGSMNVGSYSVAGPVQFTLDCTGPNGPVSVNTTLTVTAAPIAPAMCAKSYLGGGTVLQWNLSYNTATGAFTGTYVGTPSISGTIVPASGVSIAAAPLSAGSTLTASSAGVNAVSSAPSTKDQYGWAYFGVTLSGTGIPTTQDTIYVYACTQ